jgi:hypothetical protein
VVNWLKVGKQMLGRGPFVRTFTQKMFGPRFDTISICLLHLVNDPKSGAAFALKHEHLPPILSSTTIDNLENRSPSRLLCAIVGNSSRKLATLSANLVSYRGKGRGRVSSLEPFPSTPATRVDPRGAHPTPPSRRRRLGGDSLHQVACHFPSRAHCWPGAGGSRGRKGAST